MDKDLTESITPYEGGIAFAAKPLMKMNLLVICLKDRKEWVKTTYCRLELIDKGIARTGYTVMNLDGKKGEITSGTQSPSSGKSIAMAIIDA